MSSESQRLRDALSRVGRGRGKRVPGELRERVTAYARKRRQGGASLAQLAQETGLSQETLRRWCSEAAGTALVPVHVVADAASRPVVVVSPSGYRLEGLELDEAVAVLRALS